MKHVLLFAAMAMAISFGAADSRADASKTYPANALGMIKVTDSNDTACSATISGNRVCVFGAAKEPRCALISSGTADEKIKPLCGNCASITHSGGSVTCPTRPAHPAAPEPPRR